MKIIKKYIPRISLLSFIVLIIIGFVIIIKPIFIFNKLDEILLNDNQKKMLEDFNINDISGNFINGFRVNKINYKNKDIIIFKAEEILLYPSILRLIFGKIYFKKIKINSPYINYDLIKDRKSKNPITNLKYFINEFNVVDGKLVVNEQILNFESNINLEYYNSFKININKLNVKSNKYDQNIILNSGELSFNHNSLYIKNINVLTDSLRVNANAYLDFNNFEKSYGDVRINNLNLFSKVKPSIFITDLKSTFHDNIFSVNSNIKIQNQDINNIYLKFNINDNIINLTHGEFNYNNNSVTSYGELNLNKNKFILQNYINNFNLNKLNVNNGNVKISNLESLTELEVDFEFNDLTLDTTLFSFVKGDADYINNQLTSSNINIYKDSSYIKINEFKFNSFEDFQLIGKVDLKSLENYYIKNNYGLSRLNGKGDFDYLKSINESIVEINYNLTKSIIYDNELSLLKGSINMHLIDSSMNFDNIGYIKNLNTSIYNWDSIYYNINLIDKKLSYLNLYAKSDFGDSIIFSAKSTDQANYFISNFNGQLNQNRFIIHPFNIKKINNYFNFDSIKSQLNNSNFLLSGKIKNKNHFKINTNIKNLNLIELYSIIGKNYRLRGVVKDASFVFENYNHNNKPILKFFSYINMGKGQIDEIDFNQLKFSSTFRDRRLLVSDITLLSNLGKIEGDGWINLSVFSSDSLFKENDKANINLVYDNINIENFNRYSPWSFNSYGQLSGNINLNGYLKNPEIISKFKIKYPIIDKFKGQSFTGNIVYSDQKLHFRNLLFESKNSRYSGFGYLPLDLNLLKNKRSHLNQDNINFVFTGLSNKIDFLPEYFDSIDSLTSDSNNIDSTYAYSLELLISGPIKKPIRNGKLIVNNGILFLDPINDPITNIKGVISINNNQLTIDKIEGAINPFKNNKLPFINRIKDFFDMKARNNKENIFLSGGIDLSDFFNPNYSLNIIGNKINLTSSYDLFEGVGDFDINISGKDTINVIGEFAPDPYNFTITNLDDNNSYKAPTIYSDKIINYDLFIPIKDGIKVETDNINILFDGDININKIGTESYNFSGKANIIDGKFYDNQGNIFQNTYGNIILTPIDNNPYIDLHAQTYIENNIVDVSFIGFINDPVLRFDSQLYTQTEIIKILTFGDMENFNDTEQAGNLLSNYFENEIERNITKYSNLDEFQLSSNGSLIESIEGDQNFDLKLIVGKQVTNKIYLNTKLDLNNINNSQYEGTYRINNNTSIVGGLNEESLWHLSYRIKYYYK